MTGFRTPRLSGWPSAAVTGLSQAASIVSSRWGDDDDDEEEEEDDGDTLVEPLVEGAAVEPLVEGAAVGVLVQSGKGLLHLDSPVTLFFQYVRWLFSWNRSTHPSSRPSEEDEEEEDPSAPFFFFFSSSWEGGLWSDEKEEGGSEEKEEGGSEEKEEGGSEEKEEGGSDCSSGDIVLFTRAGTETEAIDAVLA